MSLYYEVKEENLKQENISKYLFKKDTSYFFADKKHNWLFVTEKQDNEFCAVKNWFYEFYNTAQKTLNMPPIAIFGDIVSPDKIKEKYENCIIDYNNEKPLINEQNAIVFLHNSTFVDAMDILMESRQKKQCEKELIVVLDSVDETKYRHLLYYLTLAKSRNIFFIMVCNEQQFKICDDNIKNYLNYKYDCDKEKIKQLSFVESGQCLKIL